MPQLIIEDPEIIEKILRHLKLWDLPARPPPLLTLCADLLPMPW